MNIFIMGGTAESIDIIKFIKKNYKDLKIVTSTTTSYGSKIAKEAGSDIIIAKPLPKNDILKVLDDYNISIVIDATHPFAKHVSQTISEIIDEVKLPFIRFERESIDISTMKNINQNKIHHVNSFEEGGLLIKKEFNDYNILHLGGINTASDVLKYVSNEKFYIRVLTVKSSLDKCKNLGILKNHIFPMTASKNKDKKIHIKENEELFKKVNAKVITTKESGDTGGFKEKIYAANNLGIDVIIVDRPIIQGLKNKTSVNSIKEFEKELNKILNN
ncbi:precorrin-6x reductase [Methanobrevibacter sp. 87.7]|uniref:precorrin-6A reductase n=1 Tax=Methanobrevibacter sp. 87.7 TaxID=387957 RepID=UPI000B5015E0|nr:precorrin-6A reductase [Methanobrevibacter sp. 87.7]OWT33888.1 precorrin-6x reductase [Methanobrevibacter sp. 87.7]